MVMWTLGLAWGDRGSQEPHGIAGCERDKSKVGQILRLGGTWVWGLGNLKTYCLILFFFFSFFFFFLQLLWSPWSPLGQEGSCLSRQLGSMGSFSAVTATRNPFYHPWWVELQSEE